MDEIRLITVEGKEVLIIYDEKYFDEIYDSIRKDWDQNMIWHNEWGEKICKVEYGSHVLSTLDMKKIIGIS